MHEVPLNHLLIYLLLAFEHAIVLQDRVGKFVSCNSSNTFACHNEFAIYCSKETWVGKRAWLSSFK